LNDKTRAISTFDKLIPMKIDSNAHANE